MNFDWHTVLGTGASILMLSLLVPYIRSITKSTTRPSAVSWFGWAFLFVIATAAQASKGIDWSLAIPLISTVSTTVIACTALYLGRAVWTRADGICVALGALAIVLWAITQEPLIAIILSIVADLSVTVPTLIKTYNDPTSEPATLWMLYVISSLLALAATRQFTVYNLLFPVYAILGSTAIATLSLRKIKMASTPV
ncbi:MAG: hypothetical protein WCT45_03015 [Candidatus Paceibacterota bacterium]|jgi:hypothetical protein